MINKQLSIFQGNVSDQVETNTFQEAYFPTRLNHILFCHWGESLY
ncbi:Uncharacterised protein [Edwardsiella ictaluri]|nr:Uncharacterised protein [Edwardsiella ictaluri]